MMGTTTDEATAGTDALEGLAADGVAGGAWIWPSLICEMGWTWGAAATTAAKMAKE